MSLNGIAGLRPLDACAQARCAYCGRYGALGQCESCGAPNEPVPQRRLIETTHLRCPQGERSFIDADTGERLTVAAKPTPPPMQVYR